MSIESVKVGSFTIPTGAPEADGTIAWDKTALVVVEVKAGAHTGFGYTYDHQAAATLIHKTLTDVIKGSDELNINKTWLDMVG